MSRPNIPCGTRKQRYMHWSLMLLCLVCCSGAAVHAAAPSTADARAGSAPEPDLPHFDLLELEVEGNTVLSTLEIEKAVYPFLGPDKTIKDVEAARTALEKLYHQRGYLTVLVDIPEQQVKEGVVRLRVTEGRVEQLRIVGNRYFSRGYIRAKVPALGAGIVPNFPEVQKQLSQLARTPDRQVTPILRAGETPGTVEVDLKVDDRLPLHGGVELNNRQSPDTEPLRAQAFLRYDNLWQREHSIALQYLTSPQDTTQVRALSGTYVMPLPDSNNVLALYGVRSRSNVAAIGDLTVLGNGDIVGLRAILPLKSLAAYYHSLTLGIDYKDFEQAVGFPGAAPTNTPITYVPVSLQYSGTYTGMRGTTQMVATASAAPRGMFGNDDEDFEQNRFKARASWFILRGELSREQVLGRHLTLYGKLGGQLASQPLIQQEQYVAGGVDSVRGFLEAEAAGDDAWFGRLELRSPGVVQGTPLIADLTLFGFVDGTSLHLQEPLPGQISHFNLYSAGVGLRAKSPQRLDASLDLAVPFENTQFTRSGEARVLFKVAYEF
jgi:hemolysin activation/secretion protein